MNNRILFFIAIIFAFCSGYAQQTFVSPKSGLVQEDKTVTFLWNKNQYSPRYILEIASDINFSNILSSTSTTDNGLIKTFLTSGKYYARVKGNNVSAWSETISFEFTDIKNDTSVVSWFDPDSNIVQSGNLVSQWTDRKDPGRVASQANSGQKPLYIDAGPLLNHHKVLSFNGNISAPSMLSMNKNISLQDYSIFMVRNYRYGSAIVQFYLGGNGHGFFSEADISGTGFGVSGLNGNVMQVTAAYLDTFYSIYTNERSSLYKNNRILNAGNSIIASPIDVNTFGTRPDVQFLSYQGEIAELLAYKREMDEDNITTINNYLRYKYAPAVNLGQDTVFGTSFSDTLTLNAGNRFVRYLWSNGDTTQTTKVISSGTYSVKTTDVFGFQSEDDIDVYTYRRLKNKTVNVCKNDSININLGLNASYNILWSNGKTASSVYLKDEGRYTVTITKNGRTVFDTINIRVDDPQLSPSPDASNDLRICLNEKLFLITQTAFDSIRWSTGSTDIFIPITFAGPYSVYGRTTTGCVINKSFNVIITGQAPVANFNTNSVCQNTATNFTDLSVPPSGITISRWKWNFSNGDSSRLQNPTQTFTSLGVVSVALKITTTQGCSDSIQKTIVVNKKPIPSFYNLLSCAGIPTTFADQTVANSASVTDWAWDFNGLGVINGVQNPSFRFPTSGVYKVILKATNSNGCSDTITNQLTVNASPVSNFSYDSVCGKSPVTLKFLATVDPPNTIPNLNWGSWDFGDGTIETAIRSPQHRYSAPGTYNVVLQVNSTGGCSDTAIRQVKVYDFPVVDFTVSQTQCTGKQIQFTDNSATPDGTPVTKWSWFFAGQGTSEVQNPRYTFNEQGNYTIQLTAKNSVGCSGTKLRNIAVSAPPVPKFTFSPQNGLPPLCVTYTNQSSVNGNYLWSYGDGGSLIEGYNPPQHCYNTIGTYPIKLIATDFRGCTDTLTKYILVDKAYLDGVMASVSVIPNGDYYKIQVSVFNNSNIEITALGLSLQLGGGAIIRENWTGSLLPGQSTVYLFTGEIKLSDNSQIPVVCASIDNINNNAREDRTDNNTTCKELKVGNFDILNIYPNPAYENINFGIMLPKDGKVNIRFIDVLGQQMYSKDFDGVKGYNNLNMSTMLLNAAVYVAEVSFDGEIVRKKFMRRDRK